MVLTAVYLSGRREGRRGRCPESVSAESSLDVGSKERTVRELIDEMKLLRATYISGTRKPFLTERTNLQKQVISEFSVDMSVDLTLPDADDPEFVDE